MSHTFIGRTRETTFLADATRDVLAGRGRLVLLHGEPGIGKTRLSEEAAGRAAARGARVFWGRCWEGGGAPAFWPWIQILRGCLAADFCSDSLLLRSRTALTLIAHMVPELRDAVPPAEPADEPAAAPAADADGRPGSQRFRLFDTVSTFLKGVAGRAPLLLVLDDLHAADEDSLMLLRFLGRELTQRPILIIGTYREVEVRQSPAHAALLAEIGREGSALPLRGLSVEEVGEFIRSAAAVPASPDLVSTLQHATGGNPFFLDEIARLMTAEDASGPGLTAPRPFAIPDSIRTAVERRLDALAPQTRDLLATASVIGNEFDLALLRTVVSMPHGELGARLDEAARAALVVAATRDVHRFRHAIVAEVLRTGLAPAARAELHQRVAAALEQLHGDEPDPHLAALAYHYGEALSVGGADKAVEYGRRGAEYASSQSAFAEAARLYGMTLRALAATARPEQAQVCGTLLAMGEAQAHGESLEQARQSFERAADVARRLGRSDLLAQAALRASAWFGTFFTVDHGLTVLVEEALAAVGDGDSGVRASLLAVLGGERHWAGQRDAGLALSDAAVAMARRVGDRRALASALWVASQIRWGPDDVAGRLASATEIAALAESIGDHQRALRAHEMRFTALLEMGDIPAVRAETRAYAALARRAGEAFGIVERFDAALALLHGDFGRAEQQIQALAQHAERRRDPALLVCVHALSAALWEEQGRLDPAHMDAQTSALLAESPALAAPYRVISALLQLLAGQRAAAADALAELARDQCAAIPRDWNWLDNMRGLAILCVALRDARHAAVVYALLLPYADRNITAGWGDVGRGCAGLYLGALARVLGRLEDASAHLERALERNQRMGARPSVARTQYEAGRIALERDAAGDRDRGLQLLRTALATAVELGMGPLERRVRAYLRRVGAADEPLASPPSGTSLETLASSAVHEPSALRALAAPDGTLTIMFTDVEASTALFDRLGDLRAQAMLEAHNAIVRARVAEQRGVVVKSTGDGFLIVFSSARRALRCAIDIQRALATSDEPIRVRMGLHVGEPLTLAADLAGKAVIVAARIAAAARGGEILVSSTLRELAETAGDLQFAELGDVPLKGLSGSYRLYRAAW